MSAVFPTSEWLKVFQEKLNSDAQYFQVAQKWEGDMYFIIIPDGNLKEPTVLYFDLWHGQCRNVEFVTDIADHSPRFSLKALYTNFSKVLLGELDPMQAMLTRKLEVKGDLGMIMRNVPTVLSFVRCAKEITTEII
jgi:putative sterol carrier protein